MGKNEREKKNFLLSRPNFSTYFSFLMQDPGRGEKNGERRARPVFVRLLKRLYRARQRGFACPSFIVLFILCAVQGVSNAQSLCVVRGDDTSHSVPYLKLGGWGRVKEGEAVQQRGGGGRNANL